MKYEQLPYELFLEMEEEPQYADTQGQSMILQAKIYEKQPEAFSPQFRKAVWLGILLTLVTAILVSFCLPIISGNLSRTFFPFWLHGLNHALGQYLFWLQSQSKWIGYIDGALLGSGAVLLIVTRNLRSGNKGQRMLALTQIIGGAVNIFLLLIPIVMYLPNVLLWLLTVLVVLAALILVISLVRAFLF
jgi:hypothetical protein